MQKKLMIPNLRSQQKQINARLRNEADAQRASVIDLRKQYIFTIFLRRIFHTPDGQWLLLGGNALILRTGGGRYTQDIDLARATPLSDAGTVRKELQSLVDRETPDGLFRFDIRKIEMRTNHVDDFGYRTPTAKASVTAYLGTKVFDSFSIDIVQQRHLQSPVEWIPLRAVIQHETLENLPKVPVAPLESHLADKICAMYERHKGSPSTRMRDLADIVRIVQQLSFTAGVLQEKLSHERQRRDMTLPLSFESPGANWETSFPKAAKTYNGYPPELHALKASLEYAGACLTPVLSGSRKDGIWKPESQQWIDRSLPTNL